MPPIANDPVMDVFAKLDLKTIALLLDVDGTIIDIGPSPREVHVSDALLQSLKCLFDLTGGAVALVSGRPIADLDRMFSPLRLPAVGGHGAEMRLDDNKVFYWAKPLPDDLRSRLADPTVLSPGVIVEDKKYSLVLHYRGAPKEEERLSRHVMACRAAFPGEPTELLLGKAMIEVLRPGISKGESIRKLMSHPPSAAGWLFSSATTLPTNLSSRFCRRSAAKASASIVTSRASRGYSKIRHTCVMP